MNELTLIDFENPTPLALDSKVSLRAIFEKLVEKGGVSENVFYATWVKRKLVYYSENTDYFTITKKDNRKSVRGASVSKEYITSIQVAMEIVANGHKEAGHEMRRFLTNCLRLHTEKPKPETDLASLLIQAGTELKKEQELRIKAERDRGKIGDSKVATAMATAGAVTKKLQAAKKKITTLEATNDELKIHLGEARDWKTVIGWHKSFRNLSKLAKSDSAIGRKLSMKSREMGYEIKIVHNQLFGDVNTYHRDVVEEALYSASLD